MSILNLIFPLGAVLAMAATLMYHAVAHWTLRSMRKRSGTRVEDAVLPPISILKPLKGEDPGLFENLASIARQDYPSFEIIIGTERADDPALRVAERLRHAFPDCRIVVVTNAKRIGLNPKVNNLANLTRHASHELLLVSDASVRARPDYLRSIAAKIMDPGVGLVTNLYAGVGNGTIAASFDNIHLNSFCVSAVCNWVSLARRTCSLGASMLFRKSDLARIGGWKRLGGYLAEDFTLGRLISASGRRVVLSTHVVGIVNERRKMLDFASRHLRWNMLRWRLVPQAYLAEGILNPIVWIVVSLLLVRSPLSVLGAVLALAIKSLSDVLVEARLRERRPTLSMMAFVPLKDLVVGLLWLIAPFMQTIKWRGHRVQISWRTRMIPVKSTAQRGREAASSAEAPLGRAASLITAPELRS
jgi:ceramide glucosyltransferase